MNIQIRKGEQKDMPKVLELIKELAIYEKAPDEVETTVEELTEDGFGKNPVFDVIVAEIENEVVGFALFYTSYSTWKGKALYLEDFIVNKPYRKHGIGKLLFDEVVKVAKERQVRRMEWQVLDWNEPAINFYKKYKASLDGEWLNGRLFYNDIQELG